MANQHWAEMLIGYLRPTTLAAISNDLDEWQNGGMFMPIDNHELHILQEEIARTINDRLPYPDCTEIYEAVDRHMRQVEANTNFIKPTAKEQD